VRKLWHIPAVGKVTQRGFVQLGVMAYAAIAAGVVILGLSVAVKVQTARLDATQQELATERGHFAVFKEATRTLGEAQLARNKETVAKQEKTHATAILALNRRYSDLDARYRGLRDGANHPGSRSLPALPNAPVRVDDPASSQQLLSILEQADRNTAQLIELQQWVREQGR